jgi:hypothetical protein
MNGFEMQDKTHKHLKSTLPHEVLSDRGPISGEASDLLSAVRSLDASASSVMVNRTHRVVRQRAKTIQEQRSRVRSLWIPLSVCAPLFAAVLFAIWNVIDSYEIAVDAIPDTSQQMMVFMMWCLPLSLIVLAVVWFTRSGTRTDGGAR